MSWEGFRAFIVCLAERKALQKNRMYLDTQKRDPQREVAATEEIPQPGPSPESELEASDLFEHLLACPTEKERRAYNLLRRKAEDGSSLTHSFRGFTLLLGVGFVMVFRHKSRGNKNLARQS